MTQEEKQLLLKVLCAMLPYGVNGLINGWEGIIYPHDIEDLQKDLRTIKPYLRPMSSMTDEEYNEYQELYDYEERSYNQGCKFYDEWKVEINDEERLFKITDWLNAHHFDYRGLIEKGLALEAEKGMYNIK